MLLFQAKARIVMAGLRAPVTNKQKAARYLAAVAIWLAMTAVVAGFIITRSNMAGLMYTAKA